MQHQPISPFLPNIRRRVDRICKDCRCLKEKCMGTTPCDRCKRLGRSSQFTNRFRRVSIYRKHLNIPDKVSMATISPDDALVYFEMERIQALEYIVRHYTGLQRYDRQALEDTITGISSSYEVLPQMDESQDDDGSRSEDTASTANADLSYDEVSLHIQRDTNDGMNKFKSEISRSDTAVSEAGTNSYSPSPRDAILEAASLFPPAPSALVLLRVFLEFAQTNYFYIDEESLRQRLDQFYSCTSQLEAEDAPWVSVVLMVFALGVQYSNHYQSLTRDSCRELMRDAHDICQSMDDSIASKLYQGAIKKIPDILAIESIDSVQAFLLFGLFMLPVDPAGLSYTYFGIAIKLATQQNLHRKTESIMSSRELGVGKRVWWTAYALERRISVLYGRPVSISRADINADLPVDTEDLQPKERINTFQNSMAMLKINIFMEDARDGVAALMNSNNTVQSNDFQNIIHLKERISIHWRSLSEQTFCRDLAPGKPLFRSNVHLALNYHLLHILMGKYFISDSLNPEASCATDIGWPMVRAKLVNDCIDSAVAIVYLCHMLRREKYLSKLSHTELSSCYSAVMALVASCVYDKDDRLRDACEKGMKVLQEISTGLSSAGFGKHIGESLEYEFDKSNHGKKKSTGGLDGDGYKQFQKWVALQEIAPREGPQPPSQEDTTVRE